MGNTDTKPTIETLPPIPFMAGSIDSIADTLERGRLAVIHRHSPSGSPFDFEVTAALTTMHETKKLSMLARCAFRASVNAPEFGSLRDGYDRTVKGLELGSLGIQATLAADEKKSVRLSRKDEDITRISVTSWFSPLGQTPYFFSTSNNRKDGKYQQVNSAPPPYKRSALQFDVEAFMEFSSIHYKLLGGLDSDFAVDLVEVRDSSRSMATPRAGRRQKRSQKKNQMTSSTKPKQTSTTKGTSETKPYAARLSSPEAILEEIRGLDDGARAMLEERILTFEHPDIAEEYGVNSSGGILLYGPPGTGKTMTATAIAKKINAEVWQIDGADLINKFVGESAANTKRVFAEAAEKAKEGPVVLFLDEIDTIVGSKDDSNSERIAALGEFKRSLGYISEQVPNVLVIATTNHFDKLDEAFMRAGRFDIKVYMPLPDDETRLQILVDHISLKQITDDKADTKRTLQFSEDVFETRLFDDALSMDLNLLVRLTDGMSGADIASIIKQCRFEKFRQHILEGGYAGPITGEDVIAKINSFKTL